MERRVMFIDADENRLELRLKPDRAQLVVVDSRPELEADELRRFATVLFAAYVGRGLTARLDAARIPLCEARDRAGGGDLAAALDGALRALDDVAAAVAMPEIVAAAPEIDDEDADEDEDEDADDAASVPDPAPAPAVIPIVLSTLAGRQPYRPLARRKTTRGTRARENGTLTWTARGEPGDDAAPP